MDKTYQPKKIEQALYQAWEQQGYFKPSGSGLAYSIVLPPPNVTGSLHMGHGFQDVLMDCLTRYHRMSGDNTLWQPGTDHAGIATQMVIERQLQAQDKTRHDLGREKFVDRVWEWKEESGGNISRQMRRLGTSCDWSREQFSMDPNITQATYEAFIRLHNEGLIYRGKRLVNWDPVLKTAISDLEVINTEEKGSMWHIRYPLSDGSGELIVATTRPETLLGDAAIAVHPDDERYQGLIGKTVALPLCEREIPIIADDYVDKEFGTGCVKITPAHDFNDNEVGKRHDLPLINIFTPEAIINGNGPKAYQGLERFAARKQIVADLDKAGLLEKTEDHTLKVPRNDRGHAIVEPYLSDQWYLNVKPLAEPAIEAVKSGKTRFIPENYSNIYYRWMEDIQDWCISRQLWWGHRIPAWYDEQDNVYVGFDEADVRQKHKLADSVVLRQDDDVFDTWFTAGLWPMSSMGWPEKTTELKTFYPTSVLVTGFDIIFFWVARMIMFGLKFMGDVPFKDIYIHGLIRDQDGQKMSKTKGNVLDPIDLIDGIELEPLIEKRTYGMMQERLKEKVTKSTKKHFPEGIAAYGTDALRFTYCALASTSRDICFDISRMEGYRNFCNKLWNAARFVHMQVEGQSLQLPENHVCAPIEQWIWHRLNQTISQMHKSLSQYRFDHFAQAIYDFVWNDYCDWYLELSKVTLADPSVDEKAKAAVRYTLVHVLEHILRLAHPIIPFITETVWQDLQPLTQVKGESIMLQPYPVCDNECDKPKAEQAIEWLKSIITALRTLRSEIQLPPKQTVPLLIQEASADEQTQINLYLPWLKVLAKAEQIEFIETDAALPATATVLVGKIAFHVPLEGLIDKNAEIARLKKAIAKLEQEIQFVSKKLANERFVNSAPEAVVAKEKTRLTQAQEQLEPLRSQLSKLQ